MQQRELLSERSFPRNRTALSLTSTGNSYSATYGYAANSNQLQTVTQGTSVRTLSYTANGNTQQDQFGSAQVFTYTYNQDNRLIQASLGGVPQASYTQNYLGQRVIKAIGAVATHFHYDRGGHLIAESDGSGNAQREYLFLDDTPIAFITPSGVDFIHPDHLGTPQKMTDTNQIVVWDGASSDPFMMNPLPMTPAMGLRFPGEYYDSETGLHYNYFRDYDPSLGRYTESDPIGLGGGVNTYAYANDNPTLYADPFGLQSIPDPNGVIPGGPWAHAPGQRPGAFYGPPQPQGGREQCQWVPPDGQGGPKGSQGYWKTKSPNGPWQRFDQSGNPISPEQAHPGNGSQARAPANPSDEPQAPPPTNPLPPFLRFGAPVSAFLGTMFYSPPAY